MNTYTSVPPDIPGSIPGRYIAYKAKQTGESMTETKFCHNCGTEIDSKAVTCPNCGVLQTGMSIPGKVITGTKNEGLAAVLSFFVPGLGQMYNGDIGKGLVLIVIGITNLFLTVVTLGIWALVGIPIAIIIVVYAIYDAYTTAKKINEGMVV